MKRPIVVFALGLALIAGQCQNWCPPGATWKFDTGNPWFDAQRRYTYVGDTLFEGHTAQRIEVMSQMFWQDTLNETGAGYVFTRSDGDVVWEWNGQEWDTLYWFSAVPGDSWQPFWAFYADCPDHAWHVVDTATVVIDGVPLRRLWAELRENGEPNSGGGSGSIFTERIGGYGGITFPDLPPCGGIVECYCTFTCYRDDEINADGNCAMTLSTDDHPIELSRVSIHPNPGNGSLQLSGLGGRPAHLRLLDPQGRVQLEIRNVTELQRVNVEHIPSGTYLLDVFDPAAGRQMLRWVKQ